MPPGVWGPGRWAVLLALVVLLPACSSVDAPSTGAAPASGAGQTRVHYIAADEVAWDYAPSGRNLITGRPFGDAENVYMASGPDRIGRVNRKSLFREYTDGTFSRLMPRPDAWRHLGLLGPVIHAEVGDTIRVVFRNNTSLPASMHPHGVFYDKSSEGALYDDGTTGAAKADDSVPHGGTHTYVWRVPERAGPGPMDSSSVMWMYHSHTDEVLDTYAGLMGGIVVTRRRMARADGSPRDVDREFMTMFMVSDENRSPWLDDNIRTYTSNPGSVRKEDPDFMESNRKHVINGYVFGNLPGLEMKRGEHVRWYVMGMGTEVDLHTPHFHGNTVVAMGMRTDVLSLLPATMVVADMVPDDPGTWLYHCHVADHISAGMLSDYVVH
ncbi:MAG TPA: multicopper oxidase domain-containing protein [Candidatus Dormibacteraeota bacterium]|nr:multicopper oxidase domain-containing protein [Candidatus Dormibacteraeota bacterium]